MCEMSRLSHEGFPQQKWALEDQKNCTAIVPVKRSISCFLLFEQKDQVKADQGFFVEVDLSRLVGSMNPLTISCRI